QASLSDSSAPDAATTRLQTRAQLETPAAVPSLLVRGIHHRGTSGAPNESAGNETVPAGSINMTNKVVSVGIVGAGYWGPNLIRNLAETPGCEVKYVCDAREQALAH